MQAHDDLRLFLARAHRDRDLRTAADARRLEEARGGRRSPRVRIGYSFIRLGERLASELPFEAARPREGGGVTRTIETLP